MGTKAKKNTLQPDGCACWICKHDRTVNYNKLIAKRDKLIGELKETKKDIVHLRKRRERLDGVTP